MSEKQYLIEVTGKVQLVGFRTFVEANARSLGLEGLVFNDRNGRVKILCGGSEGKINALIRLIEVGAQDMGAIIESVEKREIPVAIPLPPTFFKEPTVELKDIKDRLDEGVEVLKSMDGKLDTLDKMDKKLGTLEEIKQLLARIVEK